MENTTTDTTEGTGPVDVLLVAGDPEWGRATSAALEETSDRLSVHVAASAGEATSLLDRSSVDCVVCDHRLPEVDGREFFDAVRDERPALPFVLVTDPATADVTGEAIAAGVDDCFVRRAARDGTAALANRIETVVRNRRLRRLAAERAEQYRAVVERTREGIYVLQDCRLRVVDERLVELTGYAEAELLGRDPVSVFVHADDREAVRWATTSEGTDRDDPTEVRVVRPDGEERVCELRTGPVTLDGDPAVLGSLRDVTERRRRERTLRRERDINSAVRDILVGSSRGEDIERSFCEELVRHENVAFAWIGRRTAADELVPRTWAGRGEGYLDRVTLSADEERETAAEPSLWAVRNGEPRFVDSLSDHLETSWRDAAVERGYEAVAAFPLEYHGISQGVLSVYLTGGFDEGTRTLFADLAESLSYALANAKRQAALTSDQVAEVHLDVTDTDYYLVDIGRAIDAGDPALAVRDSIPQVDGTDLEFVRVEGCDPDAVHDRLAVHDDVASAAVIAESDDRTRFRVAVDGPTIGATAASLGVVLRDLAVDGGSAEVVLHVPLDRDIRGVIDAFDERFDVNAMVAYREREGVTDRRPSLPDLLDDLTDKQTQALRVAYRCGYFAQPRANSADEVAATLGISRSTFLQHLRVAQAKLLGTLFDEADA